MILFNTLLWALGSIVAISFGLVLAGGIAGFLLTLIYSAVCQGVALATFFVGQKKS